MIENYPAITITKPKDKPAFGYVSELPCAVKIKKGTKYSVHIDYDDPEYVVYIFNPSV